MLGTHDDVEAVSQQEKDRILMLGYLDAATVVVYYAFLKWLVWDQNREIKKMDENNLKVCDFSVMVRNLPPKTSAVAIQKHFNLVARNANVGGVMPRGRDCKRYKPMRGGQSIVAEVTVALHEVGPMLLEEFLSRTEMKADLNRLELEMMREFDIQSVLEIPRALKKMAADDAPKAEKAHSDAIIDKKEELSENLRTIAELQKKSGYPAVAFVTFESWETAQNVTKAFSGGFLRHTFFYPPELKMKGKKLSLSEITQPTDVMWENLGVSERSLLLRRTATNVLSVVVLSTSFILMYLIELTAGIFGKLCQGEFVETMCADTAIAVEPAAVRFNASGINVTEYNSTGFDAGLIANVTEAESDCICSKRLLEYEFFTTGQTFIWLKTIVVVVASTVLEKMLTYFVENVERHPSIEAQRQSMFYKLLIVEYANSAAIMFLVSANSMNAVMVGVLKMLGLQQARERAVLNTGWC